MLNFLTQLFETGEVVVPRRETDDAEAGCDWLVACERTRREEWLGDAPEFDVQVAWRASRVLLLLCQAVVYRDLDEQQISERLANINLKPDDRISTHYSADLVLAFLPQIETRLRRSSTDDPVLTLITELGRAWPLSAVGMPDCVLPELPPVLSTPSLFCVYVDRVMAASDAVRAQSPRVAEAITAAHGPF